MVVFPVSMRSEMAARCKGSTGSMPW